MAITHPKITKQWHPTKNGNLTPYDVTAGSGKKIWWKCNVFDDHEWESTIYDRTRNDNRRIFCPCCSGKKAVLSNCLVTTHPELSKQWHPIENYDLTPYSVTAGSNKKVWWQCLVCNCKWKISVNNRTSNGSNCPICNESKGEKAVAKTLTNFSLKFKRQWKFKSCKNKLSLPFDFVVKTKNGIKAIEYQGEQHFRSVNFFGGEKEFIKLQKRDKIKKEWCEQCGAPLLRIPYWDYDKIEQLVGEFVNINSK